MTTMTVVQTSAHSTALGSANAGVGVEIEFLCRSQISTVLNSKTGFFTVMQEDSNFKGYKHF